MMFPLIFSQPRWSPRLTTFQVHMLTAKMVSSIFSILSVAGINSMLRFVAMLILPY